ncbi:hypothetical protein [Sphingomonas sp. MMS24-J13]|uniref:hypothetical protein n=1 Tax=Sphingomonas sp. MMS24-J13 TaxID=3238686 RepID=UPI00384BCC95
MSIRFALALALLAAPAGAAPLCHDLRGLYTPCPPGQAKPKPKQHMDQLEREATPMVAATEPAPTAQAPAAAKRSRPPLVTQGHKLCHDTKGLYTPCPR